MSDDLARYLATFTSAAQAAGLPVKKPGANWSPLEPLVKGSHVSLSVAKQQIQVNLNNEDDADRSKFDRLVADRAAIEQEIGEGLSWEKKDGRKKTAIRATYDGGYLDTGDWDRQHAWGISMMRKFEHSFGGRLR